MLGSSCSGVNAATTWSHHVDSHIALTVIMLDEFGDRAPEMTLATDIERCTRNQRRVCLQATIGCPRRTSP
jgi:hypothetical protein